MQSRSARIVLVWMALGMILALMSARGARAMMSLPSAMDETGTPQATQTGQATSAPVMTTTPRPSETPEARETPEPSTTPEPRETDEPREVEFSGSISAQAGTLWTIGTMTVTVNANTRINTERGPAVVGAWVQVQALKQSDGSLLAVEIEVVSAPNGDVDRQLEFRGIIQSMGASAWVVATRTVQITTTTVIECDECSAPAVGDLAEVHATLKADGSIIAREIDVRKPEVEQQRVEFKGIISSLNATQWVVGGRTVMISTTTQISGTPQIGLMAEVTALQTGTTLTALRIQVETPEASEVEFTAAIQSINGNVWVVGSKTVNINASTFVDTSLAPAKMGAIAEVVGTRQADGSILATRIRIERAK